MESSIMTVIGQSSGDAGGSAAIILFIYLAFIIFAIAGIWRTLSKAGLPGWGVLVPIYNLYLLCKLGGRPGWWVLLFFVPIVGPVINIMLAIDIARNFDKGVLFGLGLAFLPFIFFPILGFSGAEHFSSGLGTPDIIAPVTPNPGSMAGRPI